MNENTRRTRETGAKANARERLLDAAYGLFSREGVGRVGIDRILADSGCAKASLYYNFGSKSDLALAFLDRREALWTRAWLENGVSGRSTDPEERLMAVFDLFDEWFRQSDFEGCSFINVLLESEPGGPVRQAAADHLAKIRALLRTWAVEANLADPDAFAQTWHMLMKGSIVAAGEGHADAARDAQRAGRLLLEGWARAGD